MRYKHAIILLIVLKIISFNYINAQVKTKIFKDSIPSNLILKSKKIKEYFIKSPAELEKLKTQNTTNIEYENKFALPVKVDTTFNNRMNYVFEKYTL